VARLSATPHPHQEDKSIGSLFGEKAMRFGHFEGIQVFLNLGGPVASRVGIGVTRSPAF
jgi:hypothetical protein